MINSNSNPTQGINSAAVQSNASLSPVHATFKGIVSSLSQRPLKPLAIQQFAGVASRNLDLQVRGDTAVVN